ncbi:hypothetical protein C4K02_1487 [Pseudomonas synxantha]|nr:hypothetical protein C4K02_1487 [Pseudomonas synxantha]
MAVHQSMNLFADTLQSGASPLPHLDLLWLLELTIGQITPCR